MIRQFTVICCAWSVLGCAGIEDAQEAQAKAKVEAATAECARKHPVTGRKGHVARAKCVNEAENVHYRPLPGSSDDLFNLKHTGRVALAARIERGEISEEDASLEFAKIKSGLVSEHSRRETAAAITAPRTCIRSGNAMTCY